MLKYAIAKEILRGIFKMQICDKDCTTIAYVRSTKNKHFSYYYFSIRTV